MIFSKLLQYKLVEFEHGLAIIDPQDSLTQRPGTVELAVGNAGALMTFLDRYLYERERGNDMQTAHAAAYNVPELTVQKLIPGVKS